MTNEPKRTNQQIAALWAGKVRPGRFYSILVSIILLTLLFGMSPNFRWADDPHTGLYGGDFLHEWLGGYVTRAGDYSRFYDVEYVQAIQHDPQIVGFKWDEDKYLPLVYPPFYYLIVSPLSQLPLYTGTWIWAFLMVGFLVGTAVLLERFAIRQFGKSTVWLFPSMLLFLPVIENFTTSQKGTLCLFILTATFLLVNSDKSFLAGAVFGLLAFKPQLTLVIGLAMLLKKDWRFVLGGATTGLVLAGLSLVLGWEVCLQYARFSSGATTYIQTAGYDLHKSHCLDGFFTLLAGPASFGLARFATLVSVLFTLVLLGFLLRGRLRPGTSIFAFQFSGLVLATVLLSPHLFTYDLTMLILPMFLVVGHIVYGDTDLGKERTHMKWIVGTLYALSGASAIMAAQSHLQFSVLLMVAWLAVLARYRTLHWKRMMPPSPGSSGSVISQRNTSDSPSFA